MMNSVTTAHASLNLLLEKLCSKWPVCAPHAYFLVCAYYPMVQRLHCDWLHLPMTSAIVVEYHNGCSSQIKHLNMYVYHVLGAPCNVKPHTCLT